MANVCEFDASLSKLLSNLKEKDINFILKPKQVESLRQLHAGKDLVAILPTGFGKSLIFQLLVMLAEIEKLNKAHVLVITPLQSIIKDQIFEVSSMNLSACDLGKEMHDLKDVASGKFSIVYASAEAAMDQRFLRMLNSSPLFVKGTIAIVIEECHTVETWTGSRYIHSSLIVVFV